MEKTQFISSAEEIAKVVLILGLKTGYLILLEAWSLKQISKVEAWKE